MNIKAFQHFLRPNNQLDELQDNGVDCSLYFQRKKQRAAPFDSNCITPGTEFMDRLSAALRFYVAERVSNEPGSLKVPKDAGCIITIYAFADR